MSVIRGEAKKLAESWFYRDFYRSPRRPPLEEFDVERPRHIHATAEFVCEGVRYRLRWVYRGALAGHDDGWFPRWYLVVPPKRRRFPWQRPGEEREVRVTSPENVLETIVVLGVPREPSSKERG